MLSSSSSSNSLRWHQIYWYWYLTKHCSESCNLHQYLMPKLESMIWRININPLTLFSCWENLIWSTEFYVQQIWIHKYAKVLILLCLLNFINHIIGKYARNKKKDTNMHIIKYLILSSLLCHRPLDIINSNLPVTILLQQFHWWSYSFGHWCRTADANRKILPLFMSYSRCSNPKGFHKPVSFCWLTQGRAFSLHKESRNSNPHRFVFRRLLGELAWPGMISSWNIIWLNGNLK